MKPENTATQPKPTAANEAAETKPAEAQQPAQQEKQPAKWVAEYSPADVQKMMGVYRMAIASKRAVAALNAAIHADSSEVMDVQELLSKLKPVFDEAKPEQPPASTGDKAPEKK